MGSTTHLYAAIRYVKTTATGSGNGSSWANASGNLQAMINASASGDEVWVAGGTYKPAANPLNCTAFSTTNNRDFAFVLKDGVKVYGGFLANGTPVFAGRNIAINPTILRGDIDATPTTDKTGSTRGDATFDLGAYFENSHISNL